MKKIFIVIFLCAVGILSSCGSPEKVEKEETNCTIYMDENIPTHELFFNHVKNNSYCKEYEFYLDGRLFYKVTDFTKKEYDELRKFSSIQDYIEKGAFEDSTGEKKYSWTLAREKNQ